jgi:hypothetical protein
MMSLRLSLVAVALSGCGLIDSDITDFDLTLKDKAFSVDASGWQVDQSQADVLLSYDCSSAPDYCNTAAVNACPMNCSAECSATSNTCELGLDVGLYQTIDLVTEQPELKEVNDRAVIEVSVDAVLYQVTSNTLNVETPEMKVYVAPSTIMDPADPMAKHIGTIAPVAAMSVVAKREMTFSPTGRAALVDIMGTYKTPFNIIVGSQIIMTSGDTAPTGRLDALVTIEAHAGL